MQQHEEKYSMMDTAVDFLVHDTRGIVTQSELVQHVSHMTGKTKKSVAGSIFKQRGKLWDATVLGALGYQKEFNPARFVRSDNPRNITHSYDDPQKQLSRVDIANSVSDAELIVTYGAREALCVKYFRERFPSSHIVSLENNPNTSDVFESLGLDAESFRGELGEYLLTTDRFIDLLNLDGTTHLCEPTANALGAINAGKRVGVIAITYTDIAKLRASGTWKKAMDEKYRHSTDQTLDILKDILTNYVFEGIKKYKMENAKRPMRVLTFRLVA